MRTEESLITQINRRRLELMEIDFHPYGVLLSSEHLSLLRNEVIGHLQTLSVSVGGPDEIFGLKIKRCEQAEDPIICDRLFFESVK